MVSIVIESKNEDGAYINSRSRARIQGFASLYRIILAGSKAFKAAVEAHRKERRAHRVLHGTRV